MTDDNQLTMTNEITPEAVKPVVRESVIILGMIGFILLGSILPGTGRELPGTNVGVGDLVVGIGTLGIVASLLYAAPKLQDLIEASLDGPSDIVADAASIGQYVVVFVAVLIAHQGFASVLIPLIDGNWVYDLAFLLFALAPLGVIAYHFHNALDPLSQFLTAELLGEWETHSTDPAVAEEDRR